MGLNVLPHENALIERTVRARFDELRKAGRSPGSLERFARGAEDDLRRAGFIAVVSTDMWDPGNWDLDARENLVFSPKVDILSRTERDFDVERVLWGEARAEAGRE